MMTSISTERQYRVEDREVTYRGEKYIIKTTLYSYPDDPDHEYTTTDSDMDWWMDLRDQYFTLHPEALKELIDRFPEDNLVEREDGRWVAFMNRKYTISGQPEDTKEKAIRNLYLCLGD